MAYGYKVQNINYEKSMQRILVMLPLILCSMAILFPELSFAAKADKILEHTTVVENILTGNILRLAVLGGTVWGAVQSYMAGKFMILASTLGIGLGTSGILAWAKATWAFII